MPMNPRLLRPLARFQAPSADPFATLVSTKSTGNIAGLARSTTGYIKVEWWDSTTNVYGTGVAGNNINWSKAAGGAGSKTLRIYPSDAGGNLSGSLTLLLCFSNSLTSLDVSGLTALTLLSCSSNSLTSLDVSGLTALNTLDCFNNSLTSLDVSGCTALNTLGCNNNSLTSLRAVGVVFDAGKWKNKKKGNANGVQLFNNNQLNAAALNQFYTDLGATTPGTGFLNVSNNPGTATHDPTIATNKGYVVFDT
jgi:Leucine-rich repeat (LRR) protein